MDFCVRSNVSLILACFLSKAIVLKLKDKGCVLLGGRLKRACGQGAA